MTGTGRTLTHYFCGKWIGATNENSNFDLRVKGAMSQNLSVCKTEWDITRSEKEKKVKQQCKYKRRRRWTNMKKIETECKIVIQSSFFLFVIFDTMLGRHVFHAKLWFCHSQVSSQVQKPIRKMEGDTLQKLIKHWYIRGPHYTIKASKK